MTRTILNDVLDGFAKDASLQWQMPNVEAPMPKNGDPRGKLYRGGPEWVMQSMFNMHFKDEFNLVREMLVDGYLPSRLRDDFIAQTKDRFTPRDDAELAKQLKERLALSPAGDHISGRDCGNVLPSSLCSF